MRHWFVATLVLGLAAAGFGPARAQVPPGGSMPPVEAFFKPDDIESVALSPSGRWLAIVSGTASQRVGLFVFDLQEWKILGHPTSFGDADIAGCTWVNDERLVFTIHDRSHGGGEQRWWPGLFSVTRDGSELRTLVKPEQDLAVGGHSVLRDPLAPNHQLLHVPAGGGDEVIVGEWRVDGTGDFDDLVAKRLNVVTGRSTSLSFGAPPHVGQWLFDPSGEPRAVVTRFHGRTGVYWRGPAQENWKLLAEAAVYKLPFAPQSVDSEGHLFVTESQPGAGVAVLKRFDFGTGAPAAEALVSAPGFDVQGEIVSETTGSRALGVRVVTDAETTSWWDPRMTAMQDKADRKLPGHVNRLTCRRCGEPDMTVIVKSFSDRDPGQYWFYSAATDSWRQVGRARQGIDPRQMGTTDFVRIKARDGLEIPVWVTQPATAAQAPRAAVVLVHGGPWLRGRQWQWDADAQFLASRGYVVIEPEFRGSLGYGYRLFRAGWKQWGRKMQDDLADAQAWAVDKGLVDPKRVCIAGASYGGYATLMGLARTPELYRCGVAWAAVSDPRLLFQWWHGTDLSGEGREVDLPLLIGDPKADAARIDSVTPVLLAERIRAPLLLAHGREDRRVSLAHAEEMRKALADAGHPPQWVLYADEGHGWSKPENRIDFGKRLEAFLAEQLK